MVEFNEEELIDFLVEAKKAGYASGKEPISYDDGSKGITYNKNDWRYSDRWRVRTDKGEFPEKIEGEETIEFKGNSVWESVWGMKYRGGTKKQHYKQIIAFLKKALLNVPREKPFRGPREFTEDDLVYENTAVGDIRFFGGKEKILYQGNTVHILKYHGGLSEIVQESRIVYKSI